MQICSIKLIMPRDPRLTSTIFTNNLRLAFPLVYKKPKDPYSFESKPLGFTQADGYKFSNGWKLAMKGVKDEEYTLTPKIDGQFSLFFFPPYECVFHCFAIVASKSSIFGFH